MKSPVVEVQDAITRLSGVQQRLTLSFGFVVLGLMLIVLIAGGLYLKGVMEHEEHQLSTLLASVLADSVSRVSFSGKYHAQLLLDDIQRVQPSIRYLLITDKEGVVLASSDPQRKDQQLGAVAFNLAKQALQSPVSSQTRRYLLHGESILEITLVYRGGFDHQVQGVLQIGLSQQARDAALKQGILYMILLVILMFLVAIAIVRQLSLYFGNPVQKLASDMAATLQAIPDLLLELDSDGRYLQVLAKKEHQLSNHRNQLLGRTIHQVLPKDAASVMLHALQEASVNGESHGHQFALSQPGGRIWFELSVTRKVSRAGEKPHFIVLSRDITDRKQTEESLYLYANAFEHSGESILITDQDNLIVAVNPSLLKHTGYSKEELLGKDPKVLAADRTPPNIYQEMWAALQSSGYWQGELWDRRKNGSIHPKWAAISSIQDHKGEVTHYIASYTDISERKAAEDRLDFIAHHDTLTGLFNRFSLEERLKQAINTAQREKSQLAVMFIDMDRFKNINDTLGHHTGDALLGEIAKRLKGRIRKSDIAARLGGDEFVIVLTGVASAAAVAVVANELLVLLGRPYQIEKKRLHSTPSIGISLFPVDGQDEETLMKHADAAMYHAKDKGRNNFQFFTASINQAIRERLTLENELRSGLEQGEFELYYQPICAMDSRFYGVEALLRWQHPQKGMILPDQFIPIAEETGLIVPLGIWVIEEACRQQVAWQTEGHGQFPIAVNLSTYQLFSPDLVKQVASILAKYAVGQDMLRFEITESAAMANPEQLIEQMHALGELGISLAIDDFGMGYASLAYIKQLPVKMLKLDRTFVGDIDHDENDAAISAATVALAHNLGFQVVAEGVETTEQQAFLSRHRCDFVQGYLLSKPVPPEQIPAFIHQTFPKD